MPLEIVSQAFRDISMSFKKNPVNDDMVPLKNEVAISRALRNIVYTIPGERPFQPEFGTDINRSLFENMTSISAGIIKDQIESSITRFEPRVDLIDVSVFPNYDNNEYEVTINYKVVGIDVPAQALTFALQSNR
jgi:phage baseplate assembly protein W